MKLALLLPVSRLRPNPIALYIAENLKPLRDFFSFMFFFTIGASFDLTYLSSVIVASLVLAGTMLIIKPTLFGILF